MKLFLLLVLGLIAGCVYDTDAWLSAANAPVTIEALNDTAVLLKDADGKFCTVKGDTYTGAALKASRKVGDRIK